MRRMDIETQILVRMRVHNKSVEPTGASRSAQLAVVAHWWLAPAAHAWRSAL
jgi:hypothetical protein